MVKVGSRQFWNRWRVGLVLAFALFFVVQILKTGGFNHRSTYYDEYTIFRPPKDLDVSNESYEKAKLFLRQRQSIFSQQYKSPITESTADLIEREALRFFTEYMYDSLAPYWLGTGYSKTGKSTTPGNGVVSPQHFVEQLLIDAGLGFRVAPELELSPSEWVGHILIERNVKRYNSSTMTSFVQELKQMSDGFYLLALDDHIGFIRIQGEELNFLHVSDQRPFCVVIEDAEQSKTISQSKIKVLGLLSGAHELIEFWLLKEPIIVEQPLIIKDSTAQQGT